MAWRGVEERRERELNTIFAKRERIGGAEEAREGEVRVSGKVGEWVDD